jgi:hypothetical protein
MFINSQCVKEEIKREILKYLQTSKTTKTACQNLHMATIAVLRRKFIMINAYKKDKRIQNKQPNVTPQVT